MNAIQFFGALELGLIYSLVALGVYLTFRTLNFPDMTVDGSFPLGAGVAGSAILMGVSPVLATCLAMLAGGVAGYVTALLATRLRILNLLAGILSMTALYSINLRIMGRPNLSLLGENTIFSQLHYIATQVLNLPTYALTYLNLSALVVVVTLVVLFFEWFLKTRLGLSLRSIGANPRMGSSIGINNDKIIQTGLSLSNALVALAGALCAQIYGFADINMGIGTIVSGLGAVIIGEALFHTRSIAWALIACIVGASVYRLVIAFALYASEIGLQASDLSLVTAVIVTIAMVLPNLKRSIKKGAK